MTAINGVSHWIDCLVREGVLQRDLVPHRHNPDDLVPVIRLPEVAERPTTPGRQRRARGAWRRLRRNWLDVPPHTLYQTDGEVAQMVTRIVVSGPAVHQLQEFRLVPARQLASPPARIRQRRRLPASRRVPAGQQHGDRKRVSQPAQRLQHQGRRVGRDLPLRRPLFWAERDEFVRVLLEMYRANVTISQANIERRLKGQWDLPLWISIMKIENVLNALPGRADQFSLFRTHHTVKLVANDDVDEVAAAEN